MFSQFSRFRFVLSVFSTIFVFASCVNLRAATSHPLSQSKKSVLSETSTVKPADISFADHKSEEISDKNGADQKETHAKRILWRYKCGKILSDFSYYAEVMADPEIQEVYDYLEANLICAMSDGPSIISLYQMPRKQPVALFIFVMSELNAHPNLAELVPRTPAIAWLVHGYKLPIIMLENIPLSRFGNALTMLHEGSHAKHFSSRARLSPSITALEIAREEVRIYEIQFRLLDRIGGEQYAALLGEEIENFQRNGPPSNPNEEYGRYRDQTAALIKVFGDDGQRNSQLLWSIFHLEALFRYIDLIVPNKTLANIAKAEWYRESFFRKMTAEGEKQ